jgi:hypothetical protein
MGNFLETPITDKETHVDSDPQKGLSYGMSAMQGWRAQMEDDHVQLLSLPEVRASQRRRPKLHGPYPVWCQLSKYPPLFVLVPPRRYQT